MPHAIFRRYRTGWRQITAIPALAVVFAFVMIVACHATPDRPVLDPTHPMNVRQAAGLLSGLAKESDDPAITVGVLSALVRAGATTKDGDRWNLLGLLDRAQSLTDEISPFAFILDGIGSASKDPPAEKYEIIQVKAGATEEIPVTLTAAPAGGMVSGGLIGTVESDSFEADLDIEVFDATGNLVASDVAENTGRVAYTAMAGWVISECGRFVIRLTNTGTALANVELNVSPYPVIDCGE